MKRFLWIPALCLFLASCGGDDGTKGGGVPSLKVEPSSLDFAAVSAPSQSVTVTAEHGEWEVCVSETASSWLKVEKTDGTTVTVSVTDNDTPDERKGSFTVAPTNGEDVKSKSVTVTQRGVPSLTVEPSSLDFGAVSAPSQSVTVTAENVEWEVRVSETASSWLKAEKTDGTTVTVSVTDNGISEQRAGSFTVVPTNNEDVKAKSVTVVQMGDNVVE